MRFALSVATLTTILLAACEGPPPLSPGEVRWRWRHGTLVDAVQVGDDVDVVVLCPPPAAVTTRFRLVSREVRLWERRDPLGHRDPLAFTAWRRCDEAAQAQTTTTTTTR